MLHAFNLVLKDKHLIAGLRTSSPSTFNDGFLVNGNRVTTFSPTPHPASRSAISALTRVGVIFGSLPHEMTRMNSTHACSFGVSWSHGPAGAVGRVNTLSLIYRTLLSVQRATARSSGGRCCPTHHAARSTNPARSQSRACRRSRRSLSPPSHRQPDRGRGA